MNQQGINISFKDTTPVKCNECDSETFTQQMMLRKVSRFVAGTPEDPIINFSVFACSKCGHINEEFLPKE